MQTQINTTYKKQDNAINDIQHQKQNTTKEIKHNNKGLQHIENQVQKI